MQNFEKLADEYAIAKARADEAKEVAEKIRKQILELAADKVVGQHFTVSKSSYARADWDKDVIEDLVSRPIVAEYIAHHRLNLKKETTITTLRVKASV